MSMSFSGNDLLRTTPGIHPMHQDCLDPAGKAIGFDRFMAIPARLCVNVPLLYGHPSLCTESLHVCWLFCLCPFWYCHILVVCDSKTIAQFCWFWPNSLGHNLMSLGCALISLFYAGHENHNFWWLKHVFSPMIGSYPFIGGAPRFYVCWLLAMDQLVRYVYKRPGWCTSGTRGNGGQFNAEWLSKQFKAGTFGCQRFFAGWKIRFHWDLVIFRAMNLLKGMFAWHNLYDSSRYPVAKQKISCGKAAQHGIFIEPTDMVADPTE